MSALRPGEVVDGRFEVEREAGRGGMGVVYRAVDRRDGGPVALKVLRVEGGASARFIREAELLAELRHPAIIRYVGHGAAAGAPYIALEWLEGEDLASRFARGGLTVGQALKVVRRVAQALAHAHALGVVHRDIKPSNVFLVGGAPEAAKLLDFGVARVAATSHTQTGTVLGTPAYMAPEQARGERTVDARADVFALGAVLFESLAGRPAFAGEHAMAVLAKVLLEEAPRVRSIRPDVSEALDDLVARMLSKAPEVRPPSGASLVAALGDLGELGQLEDLPPSRSSGAITTSEQRLVTVVVGARPSVVATSWDSMQATMVDEPERPVDLRALAESHGLGFVPMVGGAWVAVGAGRSSPREQAERAARFALAVQAESPRTILVLATGRGLAGESLPIGEVIDRATAIVKRAGRRTTLVEGDAGRPVRLDDVSAGLLDAHFSVGSDRDGLHLVGARRTAPARTLLGRRTPIVGRERELTTVAALLDECVDEGVARALVFVGESGQGKTRLVSEAVERARRAHPGLQVWTGRADAMSAGSPFGVLASALRDGLGLPEGGRRSDDAVDEGRARILERVERVASAPHVRRIAEFIGELVGCPFPEQESVELRAARSDAVLLGDQMRCAFEDLVVAECRSAPLVLILEDLHWGDLASVRFVDGALRAAKQAPLLVVAAARPEIRETFPGLWRDRPVDVMNVAELSVGASRKLVREVLGADTPADRVDRLVTESGGHALHLEELLRATVEGRGDQAPTTVLAMVEARIDGLDVEARRVLRAASVFGEACWSAGVAALMTDATRSDVDAWLEELVRREHLVSRPTSRFHGITELGFRHAIVRDAAYGMLTDRDRSTAHRLAAGWLQSVGEHDPVVVAEHFERGGQPARAIAGWRRAAEEALRGDDFAAVTARVARAVACGASGEELGALRLLEAEAAHWRGDTRAIDEAAGQAMPLLAKGSPAWFRARGLGGVASARAGRPEALQEMAMDMVSLPVPDPVFASWVESAVEAVIHLLRVGQMTLADALLTRASVAATQVARAEPGVAGCLHRARSWRALYAGDDVEALVEEEAAAESFRRVGDVRNECRHRSGAAYQKMLLGDYAGAERDLRTSQVFAERLGLSNFVAEAKHNLGYVLARQGRHDEALVLEREALALFRTYDVRMISACHKYLAVILIEVGQLAEAEESVRTAMALPDFAVALHPYLHAVLANVLLAKGERAAAREAARHAARLVDEAPAVEEGEVYVRVTYAKALLAVGAQAEGAVAVRAARDLVLARAARIADHAWRDRFLTAVPECAEVLRLAAEIA